MSQNEPNLKDLQDFFKKRNQAVREENKEITQIIGPFLEEIEKSTLSESEKEEQKKQVIHIGKFIQLFDNKINIESTFPDVIINKKGSKIGLQHEYLIKNLDDNNNLVSIENVENLLNSTYPSTSIDVKEQWLLLVIDGINEENNYSEFDSSLFKHSYHTSFNKVLLLNSLKEEVKFIKLD